MRICPKCGREGAFGYFGEPDSKGIIASFRHLVGTESVKDWLGRVISEPRYERCYITQEELESLPWYAEWMEGRIRQQEEDQAERERQWDRSYWEDCEKELDDDKKV